MTGEGGDEWLTVGPEYMVDLLRRFDLAGLNRDAWDDPALVRHQPDAASAQYALAFRWASLLASWGRDLLRRAAPGRLFAHRLSQLEARSPAWVSPSPELRVSCAIAWNAGTAESLKTSEPSGPFGFYLSSLPSGFSPPVAVAGLRGGVS
jgi:hypothetical protein